MVQHCIITSGNHLNTVAIGQLSNIPRHIRKQDNLSSCGTRARERGFWTSVNGRSKELQNNMAIQESLESIRPVIQRPWWRLYNSDTVQPYFLHAFNVVKNLQTTSGKSLRFEGSRTQDDIGHDAEHRSPCSLLGTKYTRPGVGQFK